jgi:hypothetical protein
MTTRLAAKLGFLVRLEVKPDKVAEYEARLRASLPAIEDEPGTTAWFVVRLGQTSYAVFDVFPDEGAPTGSLGSRANTGGESRGSARRAAVDCPHRGHRGEAAMKPGEKHSGRRRGFRYRRNTSASALPGTGPGDPTRPDTPSTVHFSPADRRRTECRRAQRFWTTIPHAYRIHVSNFAGRVRC